MPQIKNADSKTNSLQNFNLADDDDEWNFGATKKEPEDVVSKVKTSKLSDDDLEFDEEEITKVDSKDKGKKKIEEDDDENEEIDFSDNKKVTSIKEKTIDKKEEEPKDQDEDDKKEEKIDSKKKDEKKSSKEKEKEKEVEDEDDKEEEKEKTDEEFFTQLALEMKEKGVLSNVELPKDKKITEEQFFELQDQELEIRLEEAFNAFVEDVPQIGKDFFNFLKDGGNPHAFIALEKSTLNLDKFDEENKGHVDKVIDFYLKKYEKFEDDEDFQDRKETIESKGKSKALAAKWYEKIKKDEIAAKTDLIANQTRVAQKQLDDAKAFNDSLKKALDETEKIGVFTISKAERKILGDYATRPAVKQGKNYVPELQAELDRILRAKTKEDKEHFILLTKLVRDKFKIPDVEKEVKTRVLSESRSKLRVAKAGEGRASGMGGGSSRRALADMIDE